MELPSADETQAILEACKTWPRGARWVLAITTGLRQGETLALRWRDLKLTAPAWVNVTQSLARVDKQDVMKQPKTEKSQRAVPLPEIAVNSLKAYRESLRQAPTDIFQRDGIFFSGRVFPWPSRTDWQDWADLLASLGLPHYRVHDLRHGYATMLLERGADPRLVQDLMGHSTTALLQVYQHVRPVMHERARAMLDEALGGS